MKGESEVENTSEVREKPLRGSDAHRQPRSHSSLRSTALQTHLRKRNAFETGPM